MSRRHKGRLAACFHSEGTAGGVPRNTGCFVSAAAGSLYALRHGESSPDGPLFRDQAVTGTVPRPAASRGLYS
jgi:hypothetical protein